MSHGGGKKNPAHSLLGLAPSARRNILRLVMSEPSEAARCRLFVVCGLPGSGKTTLARALEDRADAVRLSADEWMAEMAIDLFDSDARDRVEAVQWQLAQRLLQLGQSVVIEWGTWSRAERDALRDRARGLGAEVELHYVDAPLDVLWERVRARAMEQQWGSRPLTRNDLELCASVFERPDADELALYDRHWVPEWPQSSGEP